MAAPKGAKRHLHKVKLSDFKAKKADEGAIEIETDDGTVFRVDPPELWDDELTELSQNDDNVGLAKRLIGEEEYPAYVAAGGNAMLLMSIIAEVHGVSVGESKPSPSS